MVHTRLQGSLPAAASSSLMRRAHKSLISNSKYILCNTNNQSIQSNENTSLYKHYLEEIISSSEIITEIFPIIELIFIPYSNIKTQSISYESIFFILKDFNIFPSEVSFPQLKEMIKLLINNSNNQLNLTQFINLLLLIALTSKTLNKEAFSLEKIMYLLKKMTFSNGVEKAQLKRGITFNKKTDFSTLMGNYIKAKLNEMEIESKQKVLKGNEFKALFN